MYSLRSYLGRTILRQRPRRNRTADKLRFGYINDRARQYLWKLSTVLANIGRRDGTGSLDRIVT